MTRYKRGINDHVTPADLPKKTTFSTISPLSEINNSVLLVVKGEDFETFLSNIAEYIKKIVTEKSDKEKDLVRYTATEAAEVLGVTKTTLNKWAKSGYLIPIKVGRRVLYPAHKIEKILHDKN